MLSFRGSCSREHRWRDDQDSLRERRGGVCRCKLKKLKPSVLCCIKADFRVQILIFQHFSRSTRFTNLCTAPNPKICRFSQILQFFGYFSRCLQNVAEISWKSVIFSLNFHRILPEFQEIRENCRNFIYLVKILEKLFGNCENLAKKLIMHLIFLGRIFDLICIYTPHP